MSKTVYVAFKVDATSYQEAESKVKKSLETSSAVMSDTILIQDKQKEIKSILDTHKVVNFAKI